MGWLLFAYPVVSPCMKYLRYTSLMIQNRSLSWLWWASLCEITPFRTCECTCKRRNECSQVPWHSYEHTNSVTFSLPLSPVLTFLTILLPLFAAANATALPYLLREKARSPRRLPVTLLAHPAVTQGIQGILIAAFATLYTTYMVPGATRDCSLSTIWLRLFRAKDAQSIKVVQDAFECCGFRSVRDMAWPFAPVDVECAQRFDRALSCQGPWTSALQRSAGVELGVVIIVAILQVCKRLTL